MQFIALLLAALPAALATPAPTPGEGYFLFADGTPGAVSQRSAASTLEARAEWCDIYGGSSGLACKKTPCKDSKDVGYFYGQGRFEFACWKEGGKDHDSYEWDYYEWAGCYVPTYYTDGCTVSEC